VILCLGNDSILVLRFAAFAGFFPLKTRLTERKLMEVSSECNIKPFFYGPPRKGRIMFFFELCNIFLMYKDPVCNMMVDEKKTQHISQAGGRNVYLCSAACKREFEKNSTKYGY